MHSGIDRDHLNTDVRPQDDLFEHVNGGWLATATIPDDRSRYGSFDMLREQAEAAVRELIETAAQSQPALDTPAGKVGALYASFMDEEQVAALTRETEALRSRIDQDRHDTSAARAAQSCCSVRRPESPSTAS